MKDTLQRKEEPPRTIDRDVKANVKDKDLCFRQSLRNEGTQKQKLF